MSAAEPAFLAQVVNNVPLLIAIIGIIGGVIAAKVIKPPTYQELVTENRALRRDRDEAGVKADNAADAVSNLRDEFETFKVNRASERTADHQRIGILSDGVDALWSYVIVLKEALQHAGRPIPEPSDYVADVIQRARDDRDRDRPLTGTEGAR